MAKAKLYNIKGEIIGEQELDDFIFSVKIKPQAVQYAVMAQQANSRQVLAHTKTKGEVRGGGKKPWKQKGTGRARAGSSRSPLWKGGGVVFGPRKNRNFVLGINKKAKNTALRMVLSDKLNSEKIILLDNYTIPEFKTKNAIKIFSKLPCAKHSITLSLAKTDSKIIQTVKNIAKLNLCAADSLNVVDLMRHEYLVLDKAALQKVVETYKK